MDFKIILNVCIGMLLYNFVLASIGKVLLRYFLDNSTTIQKEKKSFREELNKKLKEKQNETNTI